MNHNSFSIIALIASVFFGGAYLRGEISRRSELKAELREIKAEQARTMARVDSVNKVYAAQRIQLLTQTEKLYGQLDTIIQLKGLNGQRIRNVEQNITFERKQLALDIQDLKNSIDLYKVGVLKPD